VLDRHPHALLKRDHLSAARIGWSGKAGNIAAIAAELNVGLDAVVFVDDSDLECDQVRTMLPDVTVVKAPAEAYDLPRLLYVDGLFDALWISAEDRERTRMYREARTRDAASVGFADVESYLRSLHLKADVRRATPETLPRIAQLIGKTNQFNLTTRRYSDAEVNTFADDADCAVFSLSASDRFGDLGLVGVLIAKRRGSEAAVDSLLLSCRALGRRLELVFVDRALTMLDAAWRPAVWTAEYIATGRNAQVEHFWDALGFDVVDRTPASATYRVSAEARTRPDLDFVSVTGDA
jgi:FkbH-like protein